jgi:hypothetical protein
VGPRLGTADGDAILEGEPSSLSRDSRGRFYLTQFSSSRRLPMVFDSTGRFLQNIGRRGTGPGELTFPIYLRIAATDSVFVADRGTGRLTVFDPSLKFARSAPAPILGMAFPLEVLLGGQLIAGAQIPTREAIGLPLHRFEADVKLVESFGGGRGEFRADRSILSRRRLARSADGGFWAARVTEYVIERYDRFGRQTLELRRDAAWFRPHAGTPISIDPRPKPLVMGVHEDRRGLLWVLSAVEDPAWRTALGTTLPKRLGGHASPIPVVQRPDAYNDSMLEVIDPATGRLLASQRFPYQLWLLVDDGAVANRAEDKEGNFFIQVWWVDSHIAHR